MATQGQAIRQELRTEMATQAQELPAEMGSLAKGLENEFRRQTGMVADGVALANERLERVDSRLDQLTVEVRRGFAEVRADLRGLHETDERLAREQDALRTRVDRLESDRR